MHKEDSLPPPPPLVEWTELHALALFLDFDGTLVEIAETPDAIHVADNLAHRLEELSRRLNGRLALVTGRAIADIHGHLGSARIATVGSHGAEFDADAETAESLSESAAAAIASLADKWPRLIVETKPHGVAIHYRQEPSAASAVMTVMEDIATKDGLAVRPGKMVVELGPPQANKGAAVERLMALPPYAGSTPIFVGDDVTDEDGFTAAAAAGGHGVLVGNPRPTAARYRLSGPEEVYRWLSL